MPGREQQQQQLLTNTAFPGLLLFTATRSVCWHWESRSGLSSDDLPFQGGRASQQASTGPVLLCTNQPFMAQVGHSAALPQAEVPSSGWPGSTPQGAAGKSQESNRSPERTARVSETSRENMRNHTTEIYKPFPTLIKVLFLFCWGFFNSKNKTAVFKAKPKISKKFFEVY